MADTFLYLTTTGRRSGEPRRIEIWFVERAGRFFVVSEMRRDAGWVKNLSREPAVLFSVGTRAEKGATRATTPARARTLGESEDAELIAEIRRLMDAKYAWSEGLVVELTPDS